MTLRPLPFVALLLGCATAVQSPTPAPNIDPGRTEAPEVSTTATTRPATEAPMPVAPADAALARGWMPLAATGVTDFRAVHPDWDGRGVLIGILDSGIDAGVPGLAMLGAIVLLSFFAAVLALSRRRDPLARGIAFGVVMGVTAIAIHSTVDFNLQIPANAFVFTVLLALGWLALYLDRHERKGQTPVDKSA